MITVIQCCEWWAFYHVYIHMDGILSWVHLTYLSMSLAMTPVADVGHGMCAALKHTKSIPHAVDHFSFIRAAIWPCVHAMVHGDILHKVSLRQNNHQGDRRRQWRDSTPGGCLRVFCPHCFWQCGSGGCAPPVLFSVISIPSLTLFFQCIEAQAG